MGVKDWRRCNEVRPGTDMMRMLWMVLILTTTVIAKPKAKGKADPEAWDWQHEPSAYPVFSPYPTRKIDQPEFLSVKDPARSPQADSPYYQVEDKRISVVQVPRPR